MADVLVALAKQLEDEKAGIAPAAAAVEEGEALQAFSSAEEPIRPLHDPRELPPSEDGTNHFMFEDVNGFMWVWSFKKSTWGRVDEEETVGAPVAVAELIKETERAAGAKRRREETGEGPDGAKATAEGEGAAKKKQKKAETSVYFTGAPATVTDQQVFDFFSKAGILLRDKYTGEYKMKLYTDPETGAKKGDGLVTFLREESVPLALDILDGGHIAPGHPVRVELVRWPSHTISLFANLSSLFPLSFVHSLRHSPGR